MRVGVDGRSLVGGGARGVAYYTAALLEALAAAYPDDEYRVLLPRGAAVLPRGAVPVRNPLPARALFGAAAVFRRPGLDALLGGCDVVWAPAPAPLAVGNAPFVLTVHDRSWEERPQDFTRYERLWHRAARPRGLARRAERVLCDTEVVCGELIREWGLEPSRVRTVPLAPRAMAAGPAPEVDRYFLFVGALEPRKAPDVLVDGFRRARERGLDAELLIAGTGRLSPEGPGVRRLEVESDLGALYAGALAVVLPSWLEGFGLPPVEGLAAGAPAIVSDLPVLREVLGEGALYVRPGDPEALADAFLEVAGDAGLRARLLAAGQAKIAPLSWAETARRTREVLAEAAMTRRATAGERRAEGSNS
ncbi:MAG TPA: glycosyltransferase family 1 protein [Solirubrobacteraceae bacterium]|nr:glycosyltransferase family 1 protein [Solirubrobacteraceae bacterium]